MSPVAQALSDSGARIAIGHTAANVEQADLLLVSSAVPESNVEVAAARAQGIPVYKRADFLGQMMSGKIGIAVAGTAGKTTTTGMLIWILDQAGLDPTFIVGGVLDGLGTNARAGQGPHFCIEADEYDGMFLGLDPTVAAVTHLEHDHPDCYPTFGDLSAAFERFLSLVPRDGLIVGCGDHPQVTKLLAGVTHAPVRTCGLGQRNDWYATGVRANSLGGQDFEVSSPDGVWGTVQITLPGLHNVQNALVALVVAQWLGVENGAICQALQSFDGMGRRFEVIGQVGGVTIVDDYGHHPSKIRAALDAARARYGERPLWAVFQPHTYSRTKALWQEFTTCLDRADHAIVLDVYAAREKDTLGVRAADLAAAMVHPDVQYIAEIAPAAEYIVSHLEPQAVVLTLSAGDGNQVGFRVLEKLGEKSSQ